MGNGWREFDFWFSFSVSSAATIIYFIRLPLSLELTSVSDFLFSPAWTETCFFFLYDFSTWKDGIVFSFVSFVSLYSLSEIRKNADSVL